MIGPILDDRLKEKLLKPWKGALSSHFRVCPSVCPSVCLSVCKHATGHTFSTRNLFFGLNDPWDMRKKRIFLFFEIFIFSLFIGIFRFFPYITLVNFWFQASGHSLSTRIVIFGLSKPCTIENWRLLNFGPILDDRLKEKLLKPWKGALCFHFRMRPSVRLSVRLSAGYRSHLLT